MINRVLGLLFLMLTACSESPSNFSLDKPKIQNPQQLNRSDVPVVTAVSKQPSVMACVSDLAYRNRPAENLQSNPDLNRPAISHAVPAVSLMRTMLDEGDLKSDPFSDKDVVVFANQKAIVKYVEAMQKSANDSGQSIIAIHLRGKSIDTFCLDQQKEHWLSKNISRKSASLAAPAIPETGSIHAQKYDKALKLITRLYNSIHDLLDQVSADELTETIARNHLNTQFSLPKSGLSGP